MQNTIFDVNELLNNDDDHEIYTESFTEDILSSFSEAILWGSDWTTETIINQIEKMNFDLDPDFQRRDAWKKDKKSRFIESIILGLPIPPIILAEKKDQKGSYFVIDGKQRLLTLIQFSRLIKYKEKKINKLKLTGLDIIGRDLNNKTYDDLQKNAEFSTYLRRFENQTIRTLVIKNWPNEEFLYMIFYRLNTGSEKLSPQELRQALHPGPFTKFANEYSAESTGVKRILNLSKPDPRMRDVELIVRYFSFFNYGSEYDGKLRKFFDDSSERLNKLDNPDLYSLQVSQMEESINFIFEIFSEKTAFSKYDPQKQEYSGSFNRALFDTLVQYFVNPETRNKFSDKKSEIVKKFEEVLSLDPEFYEAISLATRDKSKYEYRNKRWAEVMASILE